MTRAHRSLVALARARAEAAPERLAYSFLGEGLSEEATLTYGALDLRARAVAARLEEKGARGDRCLLLYPPGLDFVEAYLGCLYAGRIAVPLPLPSGGANLAVQIRALTAVARDASAAALLTTSALKPLLAAALAMDPEAPSLDVLCSDAVLDHEARGWVDAGATPETVAFLQYTSGSTGAPKGVVVTHANLLHNLGAVQRKAEITEEDIGVSWAPHYHDMGLVGGVLQGLHAGYRMILFSALGFLKHPLRWLDVLSRHRATLTCAPVFAFELCARRIAEGGEIDPGLDLHRLRVAFVGAEPIGEGALRRFAEALGPHGFRPDAFLPCYGLAEGTLMASGAGRRAPPEVIHVSAPALRRGEVELSRAGLADASPIIGCGTAVEDQEIAVVDPDTHRRVPTDRVGELWIRGPSVCAGYWRKPEETAATFAAFTADGEGPFLRTGDLGFTRPGGEVFVTGRRKDLIIVRGHNHHPQDLERTAEEGHPAVRRGRAVAFGLSAGGEERVIVACEVDEKKLDAAGIEPAVRARIAARHGLRVAEVVLLSPGALPKTSSGKLRRAQCRDDYLSGSLSRRGGGEPA